MKYQFHPEEHERELLAIIEAVESLDEVRRRDLEQLLRRYPKNGRGIFSKSELIAGYRHLAEREGWAKTRHRFIERVRMKPIRTLSGVTPVTILTKPFPCPGKCVFCPSDVRMPKSYLSNEPGAQRAARHQFNPYEQTYARLEALRGIGHPYDKIELIVLGGTWSYYPENYQRWFLKRSFEALNDFPSGRRLAAVGSIDFAHVTEEVDGRRGGNPYNRIVTESFPSEECSATWDELAEVQRVNETAEARAVGLSLETRPDYVTEEEVVRLRRLGATKVQVGYQSLDDDVLTLNQRGHDVAASRQATKLLRQTGFKIQAHWMANLYGSTPSNDIADFARLFSDPDFRPDELKLYPCSLIESAELMVHYEAGRFRPYGEDELLEILVACMTNTPAYCRLTRVIRDIPGGDILAGSRVTNFRSVAEEEIEERGLLVRDIRAREIRGRTVPLEDLRLDRMDYETSVGDEVFLQFVTEDDRIAAFLRLCLPCAPSFVSELSSSAIVRELHVYGAAVSIGEHDEARAQHLGLGRRLLNEASGLAKASGFESLAVISSVGTREYYRRQGFSDGLLYQHRPLS